jgi:hypothetical protein
MIQQSLRNFICSSAVSAFFVLFSTGVAAAEAAPQLVGNWAGGADVQVCSTAGGRCLAVKMPNKIVDVRRIIFGAFIEDSPLSWFAITKSSVALCSLARTGPEVNCTLVADDVPKLNFKIEQACDGTLTWTFLSSISNKKAVSITKSFETARKRLRDQFLLGNVDEPVSPLAVCEDCDVPSDSGPGEASSGAGSGEPPPPVIITGPKPPPPIQDPHTPSVPPSWWCINYGTGCSSSGGGSGPSPGDEQSRCRAVKAICIRDCSDKTLPTAPKKDGIPYFECVNDCMQAKDCLGKA